MTTHTTLTTFDAVLTDGCAVRVTDEDHILFNFVGVLEGTDEHHAGVRFCEVLSILPLESLERYND